MWRDALFWLLLAGVLAVLAWFMYIGWAVSGGFGS